MITGLFGIASMMASTCAIGSLSRGFPSRAQPSHFRRMKTEFCNKSNRNALQSNISNKCCTVLDGIDFILPIEHLDGGILGTSPGCGGSVRLVLIVRLRDRIAFLAWETYSTASDIASLARRKSQGTLIRSCYPARSAARR